jgi:hypothetical protein
MSAEVLSVIYNYLLSSVNCQEGLEHDSNLPSGYVSCRDSYCSHATVTPAAKSSNTDELVS